jgi:uncharacterized membrane protein HdeD (DUF308 family)
VPRRPAFNPASAPLLCPSSARLLQIKTVLTIAVGLVLFPKAMAASSVIGLVGGLALVFGGVALYTKIKAQQSAPSPASVTSSKV